MRVSYKFIEVLKEMYRQAKTGEDVDGNGIGGEFI